MLVIFYNGSQAICHICVTIRKREGAYGSATDSGTSHDAHDAAVDCLNHFMSYPHRNPVVIDFAYESVPACMSHKYDSGLSYRDVTSGANILRPDAAPEGKHYAAFSFHMVRYLLICYRQYGIPGRKKALSPLSNRFRSRSSFPFAAGVLKRGDILPPIREVEKQTGINQGPIHRTYLALRESSLVSPAPGKRTAVAVSAAAPDIINKKCQELSKDIIKRIRRIWKSLESARA